jgi:HAMP domain-containing protein
MLTDLMAAMQSLKVATEIANGLISLKTTAEIQTKVTELNGKILSAQQDLFTANAAHAVKIDEVRELKEQIARMENWDAQKKRYAGSFAYALQRSMSDGEPPHYLCTNCYESSKGSIMQGALKHPPGIGMRACFECPVCETEAIIGYRLSEPKYAEDIASS